MIPSNFCRTVIFSEQNQLFSLGLASRETGQRRENEESKEDGLEY